MESIEVVLKFKDDTVCADVQTPISQERITLAFQKEFDIPDDNIKVEVYKPLHQQFVTVRDWARLPEHPTFRATHVQPVLLRE
jgi:hypothetical protein